MPPISKRTGFVLEVFLFPLVVLLLLVIGIGIYMNYPREVDPSKVYGTYIANYDRLQCKLVLNADGTYEYYLEANRGEKYYNSDSWEINDSEIGQMILFKNFRYHYDPFPSPRAKINDGPIYLDLPIYADYRGRVKIDINGDYGYYFSRQ